MADIMSPATVRVEMSAGSERSCCCAEAVRLARVFGCAVRFEFNGVTCFAHPDTDASALEDRIITMQSSKLPYKVASA